jgi:hypothetical protein
MENSIKRNSNVNIFVNSLKKAYNAYKLDDDLQNEKSLEAYQEFILIIEKMVDDGLELLIYETATAYFDNNDEILSFLTRSMQLISEELNEFDSVTQNIITGKIFLFPILSLVKHGELFCNTLSNENVENVKEALFKNKLIPVNGQVSISNKMYGPQELPDTTSTRRLLLRKVNGNSRTLHSAGNENAVNEQNTSIAYVSYLIIFSKCYDLSSSVLTDEDIYDVYNDPNYKPVTNLTTKNIKSRVGVAYQEILKILNTNSNNTIYGLGPICTWDKAFNQGSVMQNQASLGLAINHIKNKYNPNMEDLIVNIICSEEKINKKRLLEIAIESKQGVSLKIDWWVHEDNDINNEFVKIMKILSFNKIEKHNATIRFIPTDKNISQREIPMIDVINGKLFIKS